MTDESEEQPPTTGTQRFHHFGTLGVLATSISFALPDIHYFLSKNQSLTPPDLAAASAAELALVATTYLVGLVLDDNRK